MTRTILVHLNVEVPETITTPTLADDIADEIRAALEVATGEDNTPFLAESTVNVALAEEGRRDDKGGMIVHARELEVGDHVRRPVPGAEELVVEEVDRDAHTLRVWSLDKGDTFTMRWDGRHHWMVRLARGTGEEVNVCA